MPTPQTDAELKEYWYKYYESERAARWRAEERVGQLENALIEVRREAEQAQKRGRDIPPGAILWALREVSK